MHEEGYEPSSKNIIGYQIIVSLKPNKAKK